MLHLSAYDLFSFAAFRVNALITYWTNYLKYIFRHTFQNVAIMTTSSGIDPVLLINKSSTVTAAASLCLISDCTVC